MIGEYPVCRSSYLDHILEWSGDNISGLLGGVCSVRFLRLSTDCWSMTLMPWLHSRRSHHYSKPFNPPSRGTLERCMYVYVCNTTSVTQQGPWTRDNVNCLWKPGQHQEQQPLGIQFSNVWNGWGQFSNKSQYKLVTLNVKTIIIIKRKNIWKQINLWHICGVCNIFNVGYIKERNNCFCIFVCPLKADYMHPWVTVNVI